jgi:hypothetical protein
MRFVLLAAVSALGLAACNKPADTAAPASAVPAASPPASPPADQAASVPHAMDTASMAASAAADAGPLQVTPDNHMFHVLQGIKEEKVVLPVGTGDVWTPDKPTSDLYTLKDSQPAKLADGTDVMVYTFSMLKPGNATVVFTKHASGNPTGDPSDTRTVMFMIH